VRPVVLEDLSGPHLLALVRHDASVQPHQPCPQHLVKPFLFLFLYSKKDELKFLGGGVVPERMRRRQMEAEKWGWWVV
jgi:hypothetical protein